MKMDDGSADEVYVMPAQYAPMTDANEPQFEESNVAQYTAMTDGNDPQYAAKADTKVPQYSAAANSNPFAHLQTHELEGKPRDVEEHYGEITRPTDQIPNNTVSTNFDQGEAYQQAPASSEEEKDNFVRKSMVSMGILFLTSIVVTAQASQDCEKATVRCKSWSAYAVALGFVSALLSLYLFLTMTFLRERQEGRTKKILPYCSLFLTLWWGIGVATCTFDGVFEETGNGFFASWIALFLSIYFCQITISRFEKALLSCKNAVATHQQRVMGMIMIMSFAVAYSCILHMDDKGDSNESKTSPQELWGLICGITSALLIIAALFLESKEKRLPVAYVYFLVLWWLFGAGVLTFDEPFTATGNGYFGAWGSFCGSCYLLYLTQKERTMHIIRTVTNFGAPVAV